MAPRGPFAALAGRLGLGRPARDEVAPPPPLPADMAAGAAELQARLDQALGRLKRDIPPPSDDDLASFEPESESDPPPHPTPR